MIRNVLLSCGLPTALAVTALLFGNPAPSWAAKNTPQPAQADARQVARLIDQGIQARLQEEKVSPSPLADDAEFLRRVYLDLIGVIPPADKVAAFLDSQDPNKRAKLIDELLADPRFGQFWGENWKNLLLPRVSDNRRLQSKPLHDWLKEAFNQNKPWNQLVDELLTASGLQTENGAVTFWLANPSPDMVTDQVSSLFLGVQLQCAQCHNHPFTGWKQAEYWGMAAFFTKVRMNVRGLNAAARNDVIPGVSETGAGRPARLPESAKIVPPKFLQGEQPSVRNTEPYRPIVSAWITSPENPFFARAMVNRTWAHFFGAGFVNPVDDMHQDNPASHPELLDELTRQFVASGFDVKHLIRGICNSQAYQRTSKPLPGNEDADANLFSRVAIKVMTPEQLYDSLAQVVGFTPARNFPARGQQRFGPNGPREQFIAFFSTDSEAKPTEYEAGIPQALRLMNAPQFNNGGALLQNVLAKKLTPPEAVEWIYLSTLSRRPTTAESQRLTAYVAQVDDARQAYSDIVWAVLNSSEFTMNH
ncbi:MAG: DUF1549 and DUF1553 domain-containing protein [Gemmataceae bacterium]